MYNWLHTIAVFVQVVSAIGVIILVLLQHGKGADMGAAFGSGASGSLFGATGSANFLSRTTGVLAGVFLASTLALAYFTNEVPRAADSLMQGGVPSSPANDVPISRPPNQPPSDVPSAPSAVPPASVPGGSSAVPGGSSSSVPASPSSLPSAIPSVPAAGSNAAEVGATGGAAPAVPAAPSSPSNLDASQGAVNAESSSANSGNALNPK